MENKNLKKESMSDKKILTGVVVSDKMKDTLVVKVSRFIKHKKYQKYFQRDKKYSVHSPNNTFQIGDKVVIEECRPISKTKHFMVKSTV